jgi:hypothetical protein
MEVHVLERSVYNFLPSLRVTRRSIKNPLEVFAVMFRIAFAGLTDKRVSK